MGKFVNLAGQTFNHLTVIERTEDHVTAGGNHFVKYLCRCVCGRETKVVASKLKNGHTTSCGSCGIASTFIDLTGQRFDQLVVLKQAGYYYYPDGERDAKWLCLCDCGSETVVQGRSLRYKGRHSCDCYKRRYRVKDEDMVGVSFGRLTVIERAADIKSSAGTTVNMWLCSCECGNVVTVRGAALRNGKTSSCGCYRLAMLSGTEYMSKSEAVVAQVLSDHGLRYEPQKTFSGLVGLMGNPLSYDFYVADSKGSGFVIECQGAQHYGPVEFFGGNQSYGIQQVHDHRKRAYAREHDMMLLEINCSRFSESSIVKSVTEFLSSRACIELAV